MWCRIAHIILKATVYLLQLWLEKVYVLKSSVNKLCIHFNGPEFIYRWPKETYERLESENMSTANLFSETS